MSCNGHVCMIGQLCNTMFGLNDLSVIIDVYINSRLVHLKFNDHLYSMILRIFKGASSEAKTIHSFKQLSRENNGVWQTDI